MIIRNETQNKPKKKYKIKYKKQKTSIYENRLMRTTLEHQQFIILWDPSTLKTT